MKLCKSAAAAFYGIGVSFLENLMSYGLPYKRIHRNKFEFDTDEIDKWFVENGYKKYVDTLTIKRFMMTTGVSSEAMHRYIKLGMPTIQNKNSVRIDRKAAIKFLRQLQGGGHE